MRTRKILFLLAAIAVTLHTLWEMLWQLSCVKTWYRENIVGNPVHVELFWLLFIWLLLGGLLLAMIAFLVKVEQPQPVTKLHRVSTYVVAGVSLLNFLVAAWNAVLFFGLISFRGPTCPWITLIVSICVWLWLLVANPNIHEPSKGLRIAIWCSIGLILLLLLLQLISGISYIVVGHIRFFHSHAFGHLLRYLIPAVLQGYYSVELMKEPTNT